MERYVKFADIGLHTAGTFGHPQVTREMKELVVDPPLSNVMDEKQLLALLVYQQSAVIEQQSATIKLLSKVIEELEGVRKDVKSAQTRVVSARERAAKAEERAAKARERAAYAEESAKIEPILIQAGADLRDYDSRIKEKF